MMQKHLLTALLLIAGTLHFDALFAQSEPSMREKQQSGQALGDQIPHDLCQTNGVAVGGYDLVSYRQEGGPRMGSNEYFAEYKDVRYWFTDTSNRATFTENPERYLPAYGGFCAITLALGRVTCPQYDNFKIEDDRLLLFEVTGFTNGRTLWNSNPDDFRVKADNNFTQISN